MFVFFSDFNQIPVHPNHHIANVPGFTSSRSISSFNQVPHSGKVDKIQDSFVTSLIFAIIIPPWDYPQIRLISSLNSRADCAGFSVA